MVKKATNKKSTSKPAANKSAHEVRETKEPESGRVGGVRAAGRPYE